MTDLDRLRDWRSAAPGRGLSFPDPEAKHGCTLLKFEGGKRWRAEYDSAQTAAVALAANRIRWRDVGPTVPGMLVGSRAASAARGAQASRRASRGTTRARRGQR